MMILGGYDFFKKKLIFHLFVLKDFFLAFQYELLMRRWL